MNSVQKIKLARVLTSSSFWLAITVYYFQQRGLSQDVVFKLLSFYALCNVLFEYPTGVIGDYFSHKVSWILGGIILAVGFILLGSFGGIIYFASVLAFIAIGMCLVSGSDTALLHSFSKNFKKDFSESNYLAIITVAVSAAAGSLLGKQEIALPFYASGVSYFLAALVLITLPSEKRERDGGNIFSTAKEGISYVGKHIRLLPLLLLSSFMGAFFISYKWLYNPLFEAASIPLSAWGTIIGLVTFTMALGSLVYKRLRKFSLNGFLYLFIGIVFITSITINSYLPLIGLASLHLARGIFESFVGVEMNSHLKDSIRASVLSLNSLLIRLGSALYLFLGGVILERFSINRMLIFTAIILFVVCIPLAYAYQKRTDG